MATVLALALAGCGESGGGQGEGPGTATPRSTSTPAPAQARECDRVMVPGHEAVDLRAAGVPCEAASAVAAAALGQGRSGYEAEGFRCEPSQAGGGDTSYACTRGEMRIEFRYGTR